jgi:hypothetical protein
LQFLHVFARPFVVAVAVTCCAYCAAQEVELDVATRYDDRFDGIWTRFEFQTVTLFYDPRIKKVFLGAAPKPIALDMVDEGVAELIRWAAFDTGLEGELADALRNDRRTRAKPLEMQVLCGWGIDRKTGKKHIVPISLVTSADQPAFRSAAAEWQTLNQEVRRQKRLTQAAEDAARASRDAAWQLQQLQLDVRKLNTQMWMNSVR